MNKQMLIISGSPKKDGNTAALVEWVIEGAESKGASAEVVHAAYLNCKVLGCASCRRCQDSEAYRCVIDDDVSPVLDKMVSADVIVFATPLYFFGPSAQTKIIMDRMFSLYKWDNENDTFSTPLKGKTFALMASAYEGVGLADLERPFRLTADYTDMEFYSLLVPNAGVSGTIRKYNDIREEAVSFGAKIA